jgi:hypothetical protein
VLAPAKGSPEEAEAARLAAAAAAAAAAEAKAAEALAAQEAQVAASMASALTAQAKKVITKPTATQLTKAAADAVAKGEPLFSWPPEGVQVGATARVYYNRQAGPLGGNCNLQIKAGLNKWEEIVVHDMKR